MARLTLVTASVLGLAAQTLAQDPSSTSQGFTFDPTTTDTTTTVTPAPGACEADCDARPWAGYLVSWQKMSVTATITAATVIKVINDNDNTTSTKTVYADLPSGVTIPPTAPNGRRVQQITVPIVTTTIGTCTTTWSDRALPCGVVFTTRALTYPDQFWGLPTGYGLNGTIPTTVAGGASTCLRAPSGTWITFPTPAPTAPPQTADAEDPNGFLWTTTSGFLPGQREYASLYPNEAAFTACSPYTAPLPVTAILAASLETITETSRIEKSQVTSIPGVTTSVTPDSKSLIPESPMTATPAGGQLQRPTFNEPAPAPAPTPTTTSRTGGGGGGRPPIPVEEDPAPGPIQVPTTRPVEDGDPNTEVPGGGALETPKPAAPAAPAQPAQPTNGQASPSDVGGNVISIILGGGKPAQTPGPSPTPAPAPAPAPAAPATGSGTTPDDPIPIPAAPPAADVPGNQQGSQPAAGQPNQPAQPVAQPAPAQPAGGQAAAPAEGQPAAPASGQPAQGQPAQGQPAQGQPAQGQPAQGQPIVVPIQGSTGNTQPAQGSSGSTTPAQGSSGNTSPNPGGNIISIIADQGRPAPSPAPGSSQSGSLSPAPNGPSNSQPQSGSQSKPDLPFSPSSLSPAPVLVAGLPFTPTTFSAFVAPNGQTFSAGQTVYIGTRASPTPVVLTTDNKGSAIFVAGGTSTIPVPARQTIGLGANVMAGLGGYISSEYGSAQTTGGVSGSSSGPVSGSGSSSSGQSANGSASDGADSSGGSAGFAQTTTASSSGGASRKSTTMTSTSATTSASPSTGSSGTNAPAPSASSPTGTFPATGGAEKTASSGFALVVLGLFAAFVL
ncbi:hypothetical protein KVT40_004148 [Elsinoe batatas]|uniref:Uncharacterized protein n=1 Tax=Elsinoe batatas TaxID=2601811 RepID=A0A8K0PDP2_9PEZI|nr:hypothetical protein KVT40_004148 [Elsinoe batatas]